MHKILLGTSSVDTYVNRKNVSTFDLKGKSFVTWYGGMSCKGLTYQSAIEHRTLEAVLRSWQAIQPMGKLLWHHPDQVWGAIEDSVSQETQYLGSVWNQGFSQWFLEGLAIPWTVKFIQRGKNILQRKGFLLEVFTILIIYHISNIVHCFSVLFDPSDAVSPTPSQRTITIPPLLNPFLWNYSKTHIWSHLEGHFCKRYSWIIWWLLHIHLWECPMKPLGSFQFKFSW